MTGARDGAPVWITGIGMVTPLGVDRTETWEAMTQGRSGVHAVRAFDPSGLESRIAGEVPEDFEARYRATCRVAYPGRQARFTKFALLAARQAMEDAGLAMAGEDPSRVGVAIGVGAGAFNYLLPVDEALLKQGGGIWPALDHNYVVKYMANAATAQLSIWVGAEGPSTTVSAACATGAQAIATAADWIHAGRADVVLAGATDSTVNGFVMAEGAAVLVLESAAHAERRGATRYATLLGHALTSEAYNVVRPRPGGAGMAKTMRLALQDAGLRAAQIDYINAHGTSTQVNDASETAAIKAVFGDHAYGIPVSSQKSMIGHAVGATSAIQAGVTALTIRHGLLTPTINYEEPDPACDLDYVPNEARREEVHHALSNAFGFGGHNCCLVFGR